MLNINNNIIIALYKLHTNTDKKRKQNKKKRNTPANKKSTIHNIQPL